MTTHEAWRNRIVGLAEVDPAQLLANPKNWRRHPKEQQNALKGLIDELGFIDPIMVQAGTDVVVDGHLRVELALREHQQTVQVMYVDLDDYESDKALLTLDPISALATADRENLDALLREVGTGDAAVMQMLSDLAEEHGVVGYGGADLLTDPDEVPEPPVDPITRPGDLWLLGRHRLLCGDSTNAGDVAQLMGGHLADLVFTDPPYGVEYVGKTKDALTIKNDALGDDGTRRLVARALGIAPLKAGGSFYVCSPPGNTETAFRLALRDADLLLRQCIVWVKNKFVLGRQDYHWRHESILLGEKPEEELPDVHESILYGWRDGAAHHFVDDRKQDTVWEFDRPNASREHPTMKPAALIVRAIANSSKPGDLVLDLFGGSGSTLIACEQTGRRCAMMELDARYCDVILARWSAATGQEPEREDGSKWSESKVLEPCMV